jgi:hypothetical protein
MSQEEREGVDRRTLLKAVGGAAATVSVAGCGGSQTESTETATQTGTETDTTEVDEDTGTPDEGDESTFEVGATLGQMDSGLDPHDHAETPTNIIVSQVYEGLMGRDKEGGIVAKLATEWERVESGTVRFTLRDGVTFHDGDPVTSEDVRYSIRRVETEEVGGALPQDGDLAGGKTLENVEAGDGEVTVTFGGLNPIVFSLFATNGQVMQQSWAGDGLPIGDLGLLREVRGLLGRASSGRGGDDHRLLGVGHQGQSVDRRGNRHCHERPAAGDLPRGGLGSHVGRSGPEHPDYLPADALRCRAVQQPAVPTGDELRC